MNYKKMRVFYWYFSKNSVRIFLAFITKILQTYQQLWITMWISFVRKDEKKWA